MALCTGCATGSGRRVPRAVLCLLVSGVLLVLGLPRSVAVATTYPVRITIGSLTPVLPGPDDTLTVTGALTDAADRQIIGAHLGVRVDGGGDIADHTEQVAPLSPGERLPFALRVPVDALDLGDAGDRLLEVALTGGDDMPLGLARVHLAWAPPDTDGKPLNVAVFWPLTDIPHMEAVSLGSGGSARPVFRDDDLAAELDRGGRLRRIVEAGAGLPVTWTVDPGLLDEAKAMAGGYRVAAALDSGDPQQSRGGAGGVSASAWLAALREAVKGGTVAVLPYADPDLAALAHGGVTAGPLGAVLRQSVRWGGSAAVSALGASGPDLPVRDDLAWPYGGALDGGIIALARSLGPTTLIASGQGLSTGASKPSVSLGDGTTVLVADPAIGGTLSRPLADGNDVLAARQEILGALLDAQQRSSDDPDEPGGLVVVPPRQMSAPTAGALADALRIARSAGWVKLVDPDEIAQPRGDLPSARVGTVAEKGRTGGDSVGGRRREPQSVAGAGWVRGPGVGRGERALSSGAASAERRSGAGPGVGAGAGTEAWTGAGTDFGAGADAGAGARTGAGAKAWTAAGAGAGVDSRAGGRVEPVGRGASPRVRPAGWATRSGDARTPLKRSSPQVAKGFSGRSMIGDAGQGESYPQALRASELPADDLTAVAAIQPDLGRLSRVLSDSGRTTDAVHRAMLRAVSTGWRVEAAVGNADDRKSYTGGVRAYVDNSITSVHLLPKHGTVTMAGDSASIPVTVANGLQQPLGGLELRVVSSAPNRVRIDNPTTVVRAPAAANHTGQVKVSAHANGPVEITAQLFTTANGRPWGAPTTFQVKVSRVSPLVVAVIAAGVLLVLLAGAFRMRRSARRRNAGRADADGPSPTDPHP